MRRFDFIKPRPKPKAKKPVPIRDGWFYFTCKLPQSSYVKVDDPVFYNDVRIGFVVDEFEGKYMIGLSKGVGKVAVAKITSGCFDDIAIGHKTGIKTGEIYAP